jgi:hypothetical protein
MMTLFPRFRYRSIWATYSKLGSGKNQRDNEVLEFKLMSLDSIASLQM